MVRIQSDAWIYTRMEVGHTKSLEKLFLCYERQRYSSPRELWWLWIVGLQSYTSEWMIETICKLTSICGNKLWSHLTHHFPATPTATQFSCYLHQCGGPSFLPLAPRTWSSQYCMCFSWCLVLRLSCRNIKTCNVGEAWYFLTWG